MSDENCDGCVMIKDKGWCTIVANKKDNDCPCRTCLVKVMCENACKEYDIYVKGV